MPPTLTDVLAMAFQLSRSDRDRLRETIESIDHELLNELPAAQKTRIGFVQPSPADGFRGDISRFASPSTPDPTAIHQ